MKPSPDVLNDLMLLFPATGNQRRSAEGAEQATDPPGSSADEADRLHTPLLSPVSGGSVNHTWRVQFSREHRLFLKLSEADSPDFFAREIRGLRALEKIAGVRVPRVFRSGEGGGQQYLAMEWISPGNRNERFWSFFGEEVARIHSCTYERFGWEEDNFCGSMVQLNDYHHNWSSFFREQRLLPQLALARRNGYLDGSSEKMFEGLFRRLDHVLSKEPPSLLHGDLWSGNFICDENDLPVFIDPAVYYGHRQMDLAMSSLFGGFHPAFYEAYGSVSPLPANHREQWDVCNLYPLLAHLNMFGLQYLPAIMRTVRRYA